MNEAAGNLVPVQLRSCSPIQLWFWQPFYLFSLSELLISSVTYHTAVTAYVTGSVTPSSWCPCPGPIIQTLSSLPLDIFQSDSLPEKLYEEP